MVDKNRKTANFFRNTSTENKLFKVIKSIEMWVTDALKREKSDKVFLCNDIAQIIRQMCGISRRQNFNINLNRKRKSIYLNKFEQRALSRLTLSFFCRPSPQLPTLDMGHNIQEWTK